MDAYVFDDTLERVKEAAVTVTYDKPTACFAYRNRTTGQNLVVLWDKSATPDDSFVTRPAHIEVKGLTIQEPVWVDLVSGRIYDIPADRITTTDKSMMFKDVPLYDAPVLIAEITAFRSPTEAAEHHGAEVPARWAWRRSSSSRLSGTQ